MDPNATLDDLRDVLHNDPAYADSSATELFDALDEWLKRGGFLPRDWQRAA